MVDRIMGGRFPTGREAGQALAEIVVAATALITIMAFAVSMTAAHAERAHQAQMVQQAEAECALPATALKVKSSNEPGREMTAALIDTLRSRGFTGEITAYYYEPMRAESGLPADRRVYVYGVTVRSEVGSPFVIAGRAFVPTSVTAWESSETYAEERTYVPPAGTNGIARAQAGQGSQAATWTPVSALTEQTMPGGRAKLAEAIARIRGA